MSTFLKDFTTSGDAKLDTMMQAIAQMEGNGYLHNNPGNIMDINYFKTTLKFRLQQYADMKTGWMALANLLRSNLYLGDPKMTFYQIFARYAPDIHGNNSAHYAEFVAGKLGLDPAKPAKGQMWPSV